MQEKIDDEKIISANIELYDEIAENYAENPTGPLNIKEQKRIEKILYKIQHMSPGISILDIGCGTGNILALSKPHFTDIFGIDVSIKMLEQARKYCSTSALSLAESTHLPFKSNTFNCVSFYSVLHHIPDLRSTFNEAYRILKEGGVLYSDNDPNPYFLLRKLAPIKELWHNVGELEKLAEYRHYHDKIDPQWVKKELIDAGFSKVEIYYRPATKTKGIFNFIYISILQPLVMIYPKKFSHYFWILAEK